MSSSHATDNAAAASSAAADHKANSDQETTRPKSRFYAEWRTKLAVPDFTEVEDVDPDRVLLKCLSLGSSGDAKDAPSLSEILDKRIVLEVKRLVDIYGTTPVLYNRHMTILLKACQELESKMLPSLKEAADFNAMRLDLSCRIKAQEQKPLPAWTAVDEYKLMTTGELAPLVAAAKQAAAAANKRFYGEMVAKEIWQDSIRAIMATFVKENDSGGDGQIGDQEAFNLAVTKAETLKYYTLACLEARDWQPADNKAASDSGDVSVSVSGFSYISVSGTSKFYKPKFLGDRHFADFTMLGKTYKMNAVIDSLPEQQRAKILAVPGDLQCALLHYEGVMVNGVRIFAISLVGHN